MRSTLDKLISGTGLLLAAVLIIAGGLLTWASSFVGDQVHNQLAMQNITMPLKADLETKAQHDVVGALRGGVQRRRAVRDGGHAMALALEGAREHVSQRLVVVDNQDVQRRRGLHAR